MDEPHAIPGEAALELSLQARSRRDDEIDEAMEVVMPTAAEAGVSPEELRALLGRLWNGPADLPVMVCDHHPCRCLRAAELAGMGLLREAIDVHHQQVRCRRTAVR